jgi:PAS domain S-box-containing protein
MADPRKSQASFDDETRARLIAIVESSDDAIVSKDLNGVIESWNRGAERVFGYTASEAIGQPITILLPPDRLDEEPGILQRIRRGDRIDHYETVRRRKDGTLIDISLTVSPVRDSTGRIVGASKIARDITERRRAGQLEQRRAAQFETLLNRAPIGVYLVDADFRVRQVNPIALPVFGMVDGPVGRDFDEIIHLVWEGDFADEIVARFRHTLATGESYTTPEQRRQRRNRSAIEAYKWEIHRIPTPDGRFGVVCYFQDLSAEVHAREAIAASEERYRTLVSVISDVQWTTDPGGAFVAVQEAWSDLTGQPWETMRGFGWLDAFAPDDRDRLRVEWRDACAAGVDYESAGRVWSARLQEHRDVVIRATPIRDGSGAIREWVGICTDVTEQRRSEEVLREANRQKDEFLAMLGHELRNPLAAVRNAVAVASLDPSQQHRALEIARRQTDQLGRLIDDLLDVARVTQGRITLRKERTSVEEIMQRAVDHTLAFIESRALRLDLALAAERAPLDADPARLEQVFVNLLQNAAKYTEPGGRIRVETRRDGAEAVVTVRDTGVGIAADVLPVVFDLFAQGSQALDRAQGGLGIGLTVVKRLVELHGGQVAAESAGLGKGSAVTVRLPVAPTPASPAETRGVSAERADAATPASRVLIVEDNLDAAESLAMILELLGHPVRTIHDGARALDVARAEHPDLMLVDIGLPGTDGYEVARAVRRDPDLARCTLVALTGYGREEDKRAAEAAGFDAHLVKPVDMQALRALLQRVGERRTA